MRLRTEVIQDKYNIRFDYRKRYFFMGSCFSDNIGAIMERGGFQVLANPFGTVYNPFSILKQLSLLENNSVFGLLPYNPESRLYFHYDLHSRFSHPDQEIALVEMVKSKFYSKDFIPKTDIAFFTFGTSWVYRLKADGSFVANCHKMPQDLFVKEIMSPPFIEKCMQDIVSYMHKYNPDMEIVFTLSPVRHTKDGLIENSLSKARLLSAIHNVVAEHPKTHYFPAYEIMIDDLRDYRFYNQDLIHPNEVAIGYIWEKILDGFFDDDTKLLFKRINKIKDFLSHRPSNLLHPDYLAQKSRYEAELNTIMKN